ncbi:hypothetical protein BU26DRAFT_230201 [Trematosphaeria pertusa]|uniref:Uncharacterized protein n=1 Tax=Trematosphaeria pertusa TaxID=390896 RepID=A0A6A6IUL6_9PLEO|nr:uncharacterized protein BU26DRAFT_230201 [Trematosphaeria pertusa]KAF2253817.1 hypothetical protein BU26DRAFT_230201 [Trematosphaeria pertusa]
MGRNGTAGVSGWTHFRRFLVFFVRFAQAPIPCSCGRDFGMVYAMDHLSIVISFEKVSVVIGDLADGFLTARIYV